MACEIARAVVVLFGGDSATGLSSDTWQWDGSLWTQSTPTTSPPARSDHAVVYDLARGRVASSVVVGPALPCSPTRGSGTGTTGGWPPTKSPPAGAFHALAYDAARGRTLLFGGAGAVSQYLSDTWEWDGSRWTERVPAVHPPGRNGHALAYDLGRGRTVLFGGSATTAAVTDTWEWDGNNWSPQVFARAPASRTFAALTYNLLRGALVCFGGISFADNNAQADTWEYARVYPATYGAFGIGCLGSAGRPSLYPTPSSLPWLGKTMTLELTFVPATTAGVVLLGTSRTAWGPVPLPLDLSPLGMTGCILRVNGTLPFSVAVSGGRGLLPLYLPNDPTLLGGSFFTQAFVADAPANAFGATTSNAAEARIGRR